MKVYIATECGLVGQLGHFECTYWGCVWIRGTARSL